MRRRLVLSARPQVLGAGTGAGTVLTAGSSNAKGSYASLGTLNFTTSGIVVDVDSLSQTRRFRVDIAINTGGSDTPVVEDIYLECTATSQIGVNTFFFPIRLPAGATLKARCACSTNAGTCQVIVTAIPASSGQFPGASKVKSLTDWTAEDPTNSVTLNGTTQTAWAAIQASTPVRVSRLWIIPTNAGTITGRTAATILFDIGIGGAGSEAVIASFLTSQNTTNIFGGARALPSDLPAGSRLSFRAQGSGATGSVPMSVAALGLAA